MHSKEFRAIYFQKFLLYTQHYKAIRKSLFKIFFMFTYST